MKKEYTFLTLKICLWVLIIGWMSVILTDYLLVKNKKEPIFCIKNEVIASSDGNTHICTGLGYKYYNAIKETYVMKKFIPFWSEPKLDDTNE